MKMLGRVTLALSALLPAAPALAASTIPQVQNAGEAYVPAYQLQDQVQLATGNSAVASAMGFGGSYILAQICTGYGTLDLQALDPDQST